MTKKRAGAPTPEDLPSEEKHETDQEELNRLKREFEEAKEKLKNEMAKSGAKNVEGKDIKMQELKEIAAEESQEKEMQKVKDIVSEGSNEDSSQKAGSDINRLAEEALNKWEKYKAKKEEVEGAK